MKRTPIIELLDSDAGTRAEVEGSLADLRFFNRAFGGISTQMGLLEHVARRCSLTRISLLEVAAGTGYLPFSVRDRLKHRGIQVDVTLLDRARSHLNGSRNAVVGDAVKLPFHAGSFDIVTSNLFVHHLSPTDVAQFCSDALRVARVGVIINDLVRSPIHLAAVYAGFPLYRSRLTRHDAPASVRQAYTPEEMRRMLENTPAARVEITRHYFFRMGVIAWKNADRDVKGA
jgi:ubiquinone/menaquinone biosynthesis C-methylase UbiE